MIILPVRPISTLSKICFSNRSILFRASHSFLHYKFNTYTGSDLPFLDLNQFQPKSIIIASTPDKVALAESRSRQINSHDDRIQLIVGAFDTIGNNSCRSGVSELWLDDYVTINDAKLQELDILQNHWRYEQGEMELSITDKNDQQFQCSVPLANTLFNNNSFETLYIYQPSQLPFNECSWMMLKHLDIDLPKIDQILKLQLETNLIPLETNEELQITDCKHNMIKKINDKAASSILQENSHLMSIITKDTRIFAKVSKDGYFQRYEVVGGGGSWGPKAKLLALSPEPNMFLPIDAKIEFSYLDGSYKFKTDHKQDDKSFHFQCSLLEEETGVQNPLNQCFGIGSEKGIHINDIKYSANGDCIVLGLK